MSDHVCNLPEATAGATFRCPVCRWSWAVNRFVPQWFRQVTS